MCTSIVRSGVVTLALVMLGCTSGQPAPAADPNTRWVLVQNPYYRTEGTDLEYVWVPEDRIPASLSTVLFGKRAAVAQPWVVPRYLPPPGNGAVSPLQGGPYADVAPTSATGPEDGLTARPAPGAPRAPAAPPAAPQPAAPRAVGAPAAPPSAATPRALGPSAAAPLAGPAPATPRSAAPPAVPAPAAPRAVVPPLAAPPPGGQPPATGPSIASLPSRGYVLHVDAKRMVIDLTAADGLKPGDVVRVTRHTPLTHPVTGLYVGQWDEDVATAEIVELRDTFAIAEIREVTPGTEVRVKDRVAPRL